MIVQFRFNAVETDHDLVNAPVSVIETPIGVVDAPVYLVETRRHFTADTLSEFLDTLVQVLKPFVLIP